MVDAEPVRARIAFLRTAGLTVHQIADLCGMNPKVIDYAIHGRNGKPPVTVAATTLAALTAIRSRDLATVEITDDARVSGDKPRLQVKALYALGWSGEAIFERTGIRGHLLRRLLRGRMTTEAMRLRIDAAYRQLQDEKPPTATASEKGRVSRALARAALNGWTPDMAEDDYTDHAAAA